MIINYKQLLYPFKQLLSQDANHQNKQSSNMKSSNSEEWNVLELFSGIGGMHTALQSK